MTERPAARHITMESMLAAARAGDEAAFGQMVAPLRHELQVHCYRMLGSFEDAEDAVQETFLRAWSRLGTFAGRAPFRAWVYGIATHACLDALRRRKARSWPSDVAGPADPRHYELAALDRPWLQPYPDRLLDVAAGQEEPEAVVTARETIELAFLAAIQRLPARQRAVLVLRDTLDWSVNDTAAALDLSPAAVNSALQRAHATLATHLPARRADWRGDSSATERRALQRLIAAWENSDPAALIALLRDDATLIMPPGSTWFAGRHDVGAFLEEHVFGEMGGGGWRLLPTAANRQPAFALYWRPAGEERFQAFAIGVLTVDGDAVADIALFQQPELFPLFALPTSC